MRKRKKRKWYLSEEKNGINTKKGYYDNICRWKKDSFPMKFKL